MIYIFGEENEKLHCESKQSNLHMIILQNTHHLINIPVSYPEI